MENCRCQVVRLQEAENSFEHGSATIQKIFKELTKHIGKEGAIAVPELALRCGLKVRELQKHIRTLRTVWFIPVGVNHSKPYGYYLCEAADEFEEMHQMFKGQGVALIEVAKAFSPERIEYKKLLGQHDLFATGQVGV